MPGIAGSGYPASSLLWEFFCFQYQSPMTAAPPPAKRLPMIHIHLVLSSFSFSSGTFPVSSTFIPKDFFTGFITRSNTVSLAFIRKCIRVTA